MSKVLVTVGDTPFEKLPHVVAQAQPTKISITKGNSVEIKVNLTYDYKSGFGAPQQVVVKMATPNSYVHLKAVQNLTDHEIISIIEKSIGTGIDPSGLFNIKHLVSYANNDGIVLGAGETKSVIMRITIPSSYPDELMGKTIHVEPYATIDSPAIGGMASGVEVTVSG